MPPAAPSTIGNEDLVGRRVLLVDDDPTVSEVASSYLRASGFVVDEASDGFAALHSVESHAPDLVVLDRMLPGIDGLEVFRRLREQTAAPVILLTALGSEDDRIAGLEAGADDYLTKPFSPRELVLRAQSVLRRSLDEFAPAAVLECGEFRLDPSARTARRGDVELSLTTREFDLFEFLLKHPNQVFSREDLLRTVWGWTYGDLSTVTVHVRRLREKIERDPRAPTMLTTVWGVGYRFTMEAADAVG
ncbi:response regulator transcription factor [Agromyces lapidis]|uniref:Response regulator transcription factor n=1 Tax=Agromyces lapidis TaxID=279574 RepID=A0ABV5STA5_9MICO|nr:response regulator transcription factor [Agromyces lapidis]